MKPALLLLIIFGVHSYFVNAQKTKIAHIYVSANRNNSSTKIVANLLEEKIREFPAATTTVDPKVTDAIVEVVTEMITDDAGHFVGFAVSNVLATVETYKERDPLTKRMETYTYKKFVLHRLAIASPRNPIEKVVDGIVANTKLYLIDQLTLRRPGVIFMTGPQ